MASADTAMPIKEADAKTDSPTKTNYQMSVKTDEKSAAVSDSQAGDASTHEATTEVKAAAQVEEGASDGSSPGDVGKLDVHLTYLWEVHRVNFYVGGDLNVLFVHTSESYVTAHVQVRSDICLVPAAQSYVFLTCCQGVFMS